jgi:hypothetical protein
MQSALVIRKDSNIERSPPLDAPGVFAMCLMPLGFAYLNGAYYHLDE